MRQDSIKTRKSLLTAAGEVFAAKGYRDATIAEISERAGTNVAAVNYHFGDKETLYREAWRQSFRDSIEAYPPDGGVHGDASARQRLQGVLFALIRRVTDENSREFIIVHKELANPTGLLEEVMGREIGPLREKIEGLVREILGRNSAKKRVRFVAISLISQCVFPAFMNMAERSGAGCGDDSWTIKDVEGYAEHVVAFSLAAMETPRRGAKAVPDTKRMPAHGQ